MGIYESTPEFWALDGIPQSFKEELLPPNIDPLLPHLKRLAVRLPIFEKAGIKTINNGPMCLTPDGLPLLGPIPAMPGLWLATGFNVGIGTGGSVRQSSLPNGSPRGIHLPSSTPCTLIVLETHWRRARHWMRLKRSTLAGINCRVESRTFPGRDQTSHDG